MVTNLALYSLYFVFGALLLLFAFYKFIFLRDPERKIPEGSNIVSPADGRIIRISEIKSRGDKIEIGKGWLGSVVSLLGGGGSILVSIFMSPLDVHVNRAPFSGTVTQIRYQKGSFFNAGNKSKSLTNENNQIILKTSIGLIGVIQIAGFIARRIECFVRENQKINKGDRIGIIKFGSQVSLIIPKEKVRVVAREGEKVRAGESIIAEVVK